MGAVLVGGGVQVLDKTDNTQPRMFKWAKPEDG